MTEEHDMPITEELREMVGNPYPSADLARRARGRATELRRRRMASVTASALAVGVLTVPAFVVARDQSASRTGVAGAGGDVGVKASASAGPAGPSASAAGTGKRPLVATDKLAAVDDVRIAAAQHLLGTGFVEVQAGAIVDTTSGADVGTSAMFKATSGGGTVGIQWTNVDNLPAGGGAGASGTTGTDKGTVHSSAAPGVAAEADAVVVTGAMSGDGKLQISVKVAQGVVGSTPILVGNALTTFASELRSASN
jgi:hypothetical protein